MRPSLLAFGIVLAACSASATPTFEAIDVGVPTDGTRQLDGYRAFILRLDPNGTDISAINMNALPSYSEGSAGIYGDIHQQWTDPTGQGRYTVTTPGPAFANNGTPTSGNFDSHFLSLNGLVGTLVTAQVAEYAGFDGFDISQSPLPSDGTIGYADRVNRFDPDPDDFLFWSSGLNGTMTFAAAWPGDAPALDVAYVVSDSTFSFAAHVESASGGNFFIGDTVTAPEPSIGLLVAGSIAFLLRRQAG
jgi:hypothetical protein